MDHVFKRYNVSLFFTILLQNIEDTDVKKLVEYALDISNKYHGCK